MKANYYKSPKLTYIMYIKANKKFKIVVFNYKNLSFK